MNTEKMLLNMALKSMKDNFLSLDDEKKQKEFNRLLDENQELNAKIKIYENPEYLTLMFMYCDEKAKDKIKGLKKQLEDKEERLERLRISAIGHAERELDLENQQKEFIEYMEDKIYSIEPKGTGINYNCEYDSEEDFISAMKEQSKLNTLKEDLSKYKEIIGVSDD